MQIVINVPEKLVCEGFERPFTEEEKNILIKAIGNGIPLPKGHGRLIDADKLQDNISRDKREAFTKHQVWLKASIYNPDARTIIRADKAESEEI